MDKPLPSHPDVDALAAGVVATPDDLAAWAAYIDACIDYGLDDWAERAAQYLRASSAERVKMLADNWKNWQFGDALLDDLFSKAVMEMAEVDRKAQELRRAGGRALRQSITPAADAIRRAMGRVHARNSPGHPDQPPPTSGL
jgi:hypothetical protein